MKMGAVLIGERESLGRNHLTTEIDRADEDLAVLLDLLSDDESEER